MECEWGECGTEGGRLRFEKAGIVYYNWLLEPDIAEVIYLSLLRVPRPSTAPLNRTILVKNTVTTC